MWKKGLILAAVLTMVALLPVSGGASTCQSECSQSYWSCPTQCGGTWAQCAEGYDTCMYGCQTYGHAWLIC